MLARKGRASYLGERSVGHQDPGATSTALLVAAAARTLGWGEPAMTGIVVVSHSRALADAAVALASEMVHGSKVRIAVAAGLDATTFGTDATAIVDAITAADDGDGVVVLMDLGSAVLSAEMALDMVDPDVRERAVLCPAPLVEGLVVAAVAAAGGAGPAEVAAEAVGSLAAKQAHVGGAGRRTAVGDRTHSPADSGPGVESAVMKITNRHGLHARPAARLVQEARLYDARIELRNLDTGRRARAGDQPVAGGHARRAVRAPGRGDRDRQPGARGRRPRGRAGRAALRRARAASTNPARRPPLRVERRAAAGVPWHRDRPRADHPRRRRRTRPTSRPVTPTPSGAGSARRWRRSAARSSGSGPWLPAQAGEEDARIFDAHLMLIDDADLLDDVHERIAPGSGRGPGLARRGRPRSRASSASVADAYLRARAADVRDVGQQVARVLVGAPALSIEGEGVLVADDLTPAQVAELDADRVRGLRPGRRAARPGTARSWRGPAAIPAVVGGRAGVLDVPVGTTVALDGSTGQVFVDPDAETLARLQPAGRRGPRAGRPGARRRALARRHRRRGRGRGRRQPRLGRRRARRGPPRRRPAPGWSAPSSSTSTGATRPTVEEQVEVYRALADALGGRTITLRTLDVGGDKPLPYAPAAAGGQPVPRRARASGWPSPSGELLEDQLRAIVAVAHETPGRA